MALAPPPYLHYGGTQDLEERFGKGSRCALLETTGQEQDGTEGFLSFKASTTSSWKPETEGEEGDERREGMKGRREMKGGKG